jgi:hypothetical protein
MLRRLLVALLKGVMLSVLLLGACARPGVAYMQSPHWLIKTVGNPLPRGFHVALRDGGPQQVEVKRLDPRKLPSIDPRYHLPDGQLRYSWGPGEGHATVDVTRHPSGAQVVRVYVVGDSPWTSLSEYMVANNQLQPLRHADSAAWLLLGIPILTGIAAALSQRFGGARPINRRGPQC